MKNFMFGLMGMALFISGCGVLKDSEKRKLPEGLSQGDQASTLPTPQDYADFEAECKEDKGNGHKGSYDSTTKLCTFTLYTHDIPAVVTHLLELDLTLIPNNAVMSAHFITLPR